MTARTGADAKVLSAIPAYQPATVQAAAHSPSFVADMSAANDRAPRHEMYLAVHKGLRACMAETLLTLGRVDARTAASVAEALAMVDDLLGLCTDHLRHENDFIHPALERVVPGASARCAADHVEHQADIAKLHARRDAALQADGPARERALVVLYRLLALFVAENFAHMNVEETAHTETLWAHYSDAELLAIEQNLIAHIEPDRLMAFLRWILPFVSRQERAVMLRGMRAGMPAEAFNGLIDALKPHFRPQDWEAVALDLAD